MPIHLGGVLSFTNYKKPDQTSLDRDPELDVLDVETEELFDHITDMAARLLDTPISLISLVDRNRQWIKIGIGTELKRTARDVSFCSHVIRHKTVQVVKDATADPRFQDSALVAMEDGVKSLAGAPLRSKMGYNLGAIFAIDVRKRNFNFEQQEILCDLATIIVGHLEMRLLADRAITAEQRLVDAVDALPDGLVFYDKEDRLVLCNQRYREIYAESADLIVPGTRFEDIIRGGVYRGQYPEAAGNEESFVAQRVMIHQNPGEPIEQELPGDRWLRIQEGRTSEGGIIGFRFDITTLKRQERELTRLAWTDSLTGTLSRSRFMDLAALEFTAVKRQGGSLALLILDIDHFKWINDNLGHSAGDRVLVEISNRWNETLRSDDLLGRLGGEEFGILLPQVNIDGACAVAEKLLRITTVPPVIFDGKQVPVTVSIGIAMIEEEIHCIDELMLMADKALYEVKRNGRNGVQVSSV